ncbi:hypothetical protein AB0D56_09990 [Streptomyces sp. NPDC048209]|uniref:DUF6919 domain-containing protein n=1 Tax=Streptomyces sp. NPDC048209 TaxID=3156689 RepID=UPI00343F252E
MRLPWMTRRDCRAWQSANTVADLGQLTARWLEGDIKTMIGYVPNTPPDDETAAIAPTLAAANRAGFLTDCSQPGLDGTGHDGARWQQRAAVTGFIADPDLLERIRYAAADAGLIVVIHHPGDPEGWCIPGYAVVTLRAGTAYTAFGERADLDSLNDSWSGISPVACLAVAAAAQVTLADPLFGRNDLLWPLLDDLTRPAIRTQTGA